MSTPLMLNHDGGCVGGGYWTVEEDPVCDEEKITDTLGGR